MCQVATLTPFPSKIPMLLIIVYACSRPKRHLHCRLLFLEEAIKLYRDITNVCISYSFFSSIFFCVPLSVNCSCSQATVDLNLSRTIDQAQVFSPTDLIVLSARVNHSVCSLSMQLTSYWHITKASLKSRDFKTFMLSALNTSQPFWSMRPEDVDSHYYYPGEAPPRGPTPYPV